MQGNPKLFSVRHYAFCFPPKSFWQSWNCLFYCHCKVTQSYCYWQSDIMLFCFPPKSYWQSRRRLFYFHYKVSQSYWQSDIMLFCFPPKGYWQSRHCLFYFHCKVTQDHHTLCFLLSLQGNLKPATSRRSAVCLHFMADKSY